MGVQFNFSTYDFPVFPAPLIALNVLGFLVKYVDLKWGVGVISYGITIRHKGIDLKIINMGLFLSCVKSV